MFGSSGLIISVVVAISCGTGFLLSQSPAMAIDDSKTSPVSGDALGGDQTSLKNSDVGISVTVAVYNDKGVSASVSEILTDLERDKTLSVKRITAKQIVEDHLADFDVVIFPGGSGGGQGKSLGESGRKKVRDFISNGGGYLGVCAGAYLASADYDWSLHVLDAKVLDRKHWARGFGDVDLKLTSRGRIQLPMTSERTTVYYHQGPLLAPAEKPDLDDYEEWASFETEVSKKGVPGGVMPGTTAIAAGRFGKGRVLAISPHPERTDLLDTLIPVAVKWTAGHEITTPSE